MLSHLASCLDHRNIHRPSERGTTSNGSVSWLVWEVSIFCDILGGGDQPKSWPWKDTPFPSVTQYNETQVMTCVCEHVLGL